MKTDSRFIIVVVLAIVIAMTALGIFSYFEEKIKK
jgi:hypothetical protein